MKNIVLAACLFATQVSLVRAQFSSPIRVKAGEDMLVKLAKEIYQYPEFMKGTVLFRNGSVNQSVFNYNMLIAEIQFIDDKGDTLSLANELTIKCVTIGSDSFFYDSGYLQQIAGNEDAKLMRKLKIKVVDQQRIGAYDQPTSTSSITTYSSMTDNLKSFKLNVRQDVILAKETSFFVGDKYNKFVRANKKNVLKIFHKKEKVLNDYLKNNDVNFNSAEDLTRLIAVLKTS